MSRVQLNGIAKAYGRTAAVRGVDLDVADGEFVTLLGASGCGKTTCLRMVAGFIEPNAGTILIGGRDVTRVAPNRRDMGMVFQHYALFPHMTVAENIAFGLRVRRVGSAERRRRLGRVLDLVRLEGLAERFPAQLSGGQRQRVALARAIVIEPKALLLDEPLSALDSRLRDQLQHEIKRVQQSLGITTIFVTHDQSEALTLSDRVAVMRDGRVEQIDNPSALYRRPRTRYVARFLGRMNFFDAVVTGRFGHEGYELRLLGAETGSFHANGSSSQLFRPGQRVTAAVRPERLEFGQAAPGRLNLAVDRLSFLGSRWLVHGRIGSDQAFQAELPEGSAVPSPGDTPSVGWCAEDCLLFPPEDGVGASPAASPLEGESA